MRSGACARRVTSRQRPQLGSRGSGDRHDPVRVFHLMSATEAVFPAAIVARVLAVSMVGDYAGSRRRRRSAQAAADGELPKRIRTLHAISRGAYGMPIAG